MVGEVFSFLAVVVEKKKNGEGVQGTDGREGGGVGNNHPPPPPPKKKKKKKKWSQRLFALSLSTAIYRFWILFHNIGVVSQAMSIFFPILFRNDYVNGVTVLQWVLQRFLIFFSRI